MAGFEVSSPAEQIICIRILESTDFGGCIDDNRLFTDLELSLRRMLSEQKRMMVVILFDIRDCTSVSAACNGGRRNESE